MPDDDRIQHGSYVRPSGDGEDRLGRIIPNSEARGVVHDIWNEGKRRRCQVMWKRPGGIYHKGFMNMDTSLLEPTADFEEAER